MIEMHITIIPGVTRRDKICHIYKYIYIYIYILGVLYNFVLYDEIEFAKYVYIYIYIKFVVHLRGGAEHLV